MVDKQNRPRLVIIAGPTGVGKTEAAIGLASAWGGEIISADSMQVYRHMDIGTAKPTVAQRAQVSHHGVDIVDPDEVFNAALFIAMAEKAIGPLHGRSRPIFVVGGTGLYIRALLGGLFEGPGADETLRVFYKEMVKMHGKEHLYALLQQKDPKAAAVIEPADASRVIRALEVMEQTGVSIVEQQKTHGFGDRKYDYVKIGLTMDRTSLYERIDHRIERMVADGFVDEVQKLFDMGYSRELKPMQSLGYKHIGNHLPGLCDINEALRLMKRDTRHYAKRQMTWFAADQETQWFMPEDMAGIKARIEEFLSSP